MNKHDWNFKAMLSCIDQRCKIRDSHTYSKYPVIMPSPLPWIRQNKNEELRKRLCCLVVSAVCFINSVQMCVHYRICWHVGMIKTCKINCPWQFTSLVKHQSRFGECRDRDQLNERWDQLNLVSVLRYPLLEG